MFTWQRYRNDRIRGQDPFVADGKRPISNVALASRRTSPCCADAGSARPTYVGQRTERVHAQEVHLGSASGPDVQLLH